MMDVAQLARLLEHVGLDNGLAEWIHSTASEGDLVRAHRNHDEQIDHLAFRGLLRSTHTTPS
jgi:hypothetical protein